MLEKDKTKKRVERHDDTQEDFTPIGVVNSMLDQYPLEAFKDMKRRSLTTPQVVVTSLLKSLTESLITAKTWMMQLRHSNQYTGWN